jgi:CRP/FNR family transcriptional regulator, polysaccharide utilization system transcription regulator
MMCARCGYRQPTFDVLGDDDFEILNKDRYEVTYKSGETICKQGAALSHISCFVHGMAKICIEGLNGKNLLMKIVKPGDMIGGPGLFTDFRNHYTVTALTEVMVCQLEINAFQTVVNKNIKFAVGMLKRSNLQAANNFDKFINLTQKHMPGRIAEAIIYLADQVHQSNDFTTPISRQDLADMTSMTKESAIRILKEFKDSGFITNGGNHFKITNREALEKVRISG